jgi:hypothetical protein
VLQPSSRTAGASSASASAPPSFFCVRVALPPSFFRVRAAQPSAGFRVRVAQGRLRGTSMRVSCAPTRRLCQSVAPSARSPCASSARPLSASVVRPLRAVLVATRRQLPPRTVSTHHRFSALQIATLVISSSDHFFAGVCPRQYLSAVILQCFITLHYVGQRYCCQHCS